jgi:hypothetical protein
MNYIGPKFGKNIDLAKMQGSPDRELRLVVDWDQRTVDVESRLKDDRTWTVAEHYDHCWSISFPVLTTEDFRSMLAELMPIFDVVCDEYHWYYTQIPRVERIIEDAQNTEPGGLWSAWDWFQAAPPTTKEELQDCLAEASSDGVWLYDLEDYIEQEMG